MGRDTTVVFVLARRRWLGQAEVREGWWRFSSNATVAVCLFISRALSTSGVVGKMADNCWIGSKQLGLKEIYYLDYVRSES